MQTGIVETVSQACGPVDINIPPRPTTPFAMNVVSPADPVHTQPATAALNKTDNDYPLPQAGTQKGLIVCGNRCAIDLDLIEKLAVRCSWPVLAEVGSGYFPRRQNAVASPMRWPSVSWGVKHLILSSSRRCPHGPARL